MKGDYMMKKSAWYKYDEKALSDVFHFNDDYKAFLSECKTERECTLSAVELAKKAGYMDLETCIQNNTSLKPGDKVYANNKDKNIALFIIGEEPIENGMNILGAHIDSPRIDLKQVPLYEDTEICLLDTHYYGGIKKYQWVALPLAMHGVVVKKDGTKVNVVIGEDDNDPVLGISDLLPHLAQTQMKKDAGSIIEGEDLNVTFGSMPSKDEEKEAVKANIKKLLKEKYDIEEEDFISAELEIVPAGKARDFGIDRSMVMGYGHDDRVCGYTSLRAILDTDTVKKTACCLLVDKEEVGSIGATGMQSKFFENTVAELINLTGDYNDLKLRRALTNSCMLSSDVSAGYDPNYPAVMERKNSAYLGYGPAFNKYTGARGKSGCNDASPEFIASLRKTMDDANISWQTAELGRVDQGGGGTIAYILANYNMQVIDCGVPVHNMHAPWEVCSKADVYEAYKGYLAFLKQA